MSENFKQLVFSHLGQRYLNIKKRFCGGSYSQGARSNKLMIHWHASDEPWLQGRFTWSPGAAEHDAIVNMASKLPIAWVLTCNRLHAFNYMPCHVPFAVHQCIHSSPCRVPSRRCVCFVFTSTQWCFTLYSLHARWATYVTEDFTFSLKILITWHFHWKYWKFDETRFFSLSSK